MYFEGNTAHGVLPNTSSRSRTNLLWSIGYAWIKPMQISLFNNVIGNVDAKQQIVK